MITLSSDNQAIMRTFGKQTGEAYTYENGYETGELHITNDGSLTVLGGPVNTTTSYEYAAISFAIYVRDSVYFDGPDVYAESRDVEINNPLHAHNAVSFGIACNNVKLW